MLRAIVQAQSEPGAVLARMNDQLVEELDAHRFMTLVLACLHVQSRTLHYASAGHTCGFLLGSNGGVKAELHSTGIPLGVMPGAIFETVEVPGLEDGDLVALFTDGIVESIDDDACFGLERALENLRLHRHEPAAEIVQHVCAAARAFAGGHQDDDMTMVVCKVGALSAIGAAPRSDGRGRRDADGSDAARVGAQTRGRRTEQGRGVLPAALSRLRRRRRRTND